MTNRLSRIGFLIQAEIIKQLKGRGFYIFLAVLALVIAIIFIGARQVDRASGILGLNGYSVVAYISTWTVGNWGIGMVSIIVLAASLVAGEATGGTLKSLLTRPVTRIDFTLAKMALLFISSAFLVLAILVMGLILGGIFYGLEDVGERDYVIHSRLQMLSNMIYAYGLLILPLFATSIIAFFFSVILKSVVAAITVSLGTYFILNLLRAFPPIGDYTINTYINFPLELVGNMATGLPPIWSPWLYKCLAISLIYIATFGGAGILVLYKKDII